MNGVARGSAPHVIRVGGDGGIEPRRAVVAAGTTVTWQIPPGQAIIPVAPDDQGALRARPHTGGPGDFTGPPWYAPCRASTR